MNPEYIYKAEVVRIIDGDSVVVDLDLGFGIWLRKQHIRLYGLDAPEIRGEERPDGLVAKSFVETFLPIGTEVIIKTYKDKKGKYGRWLGEIFHGDVSLNETLLENGLAEPYPS